MQTEPLTKRKAIDAISCVWGSGRDLTSAQFNALDNALPKSELPILDRLLQHCDLLETYNRRGRPAFAEFRHWWMGVEFHLSFSQKQ